MICLGIWGFGDLLLFFFRDLFGDLGICGFFFFAICLGILGFGDLFFSSRFVWGFGELFFRSRDLFGDLGIWEFLFCFHDLFGDLDLGDFFAICLGFWDLFCSLRRLFGIWGVFS